MNRDQYLQTFEELTTQMLEITKKKNSDYTGDDNSPFKNFTMVETIGFASTEQGFLTRITDNAYMAQALKTIIRAGKYYGIRTEVEKEAIDMICHKLARAVSAEYYHQDNYVDIAGYATLVVERVE